MAVDSIISIFFSLQGKTRYKHTTILLDQLAAFFFPPKTFFSADFWFDAGEVVPAGGRHSTTYATWRMLNGRSNMYSDRTGFATIDWKLKIYDERTRAGCMCVYSFAISLSRCFIGRVRGFSVCWADVEELIVDFGCREVLYGSVFVVTAFRGLL